VLIGDTARCTPLQAELEAAGTEVVASLPVGSVVSALGEDHVTGVATETVTYDADLVVMCGPLIPDLGFLAGTSLESVSLVGAAGGEGWANQAYIPPPSAQSTDAMACLCMDVSGHEVAETIEAGMGHIELIKRFTKLGKSACQGRMCQMAAVSLCSQISGQTVAKVGTTVARPPAPPVTLGVLAGIDIIPSAARPCTINMTNWAPCGWIWATGSGHATTTPPAAEIKSSASNRNIERCVSGPASST
jgi:bacterioferritin-associated ferredoxin